MIFVDSNIPMYAAGTSSEQKKLCLSFLEKIKNADVEAAASAEVLQEILHRYRAIQRFKEGTEVYEAFRSLPLVWLHVIPEDVDHAKDLLQNHTQLSSRDALHLAVMYRSGIKKIVTYDKGFLGISDVTVYLPE